MSERTVVMCVYCGLEYPDVTPAAKHELLTAHITVCEKHPMRKAEENIKRLRTALAGLIAVETPEDLDRLESILRVTRAPESDKILALNAIDALRATAD